ncbi:hypothetical protein GCM10027068_13360 [Prescottella soli]
MHYHAGLHVELIEDWRSCCADLDASRTTEAESATAETVPPRAVVDPVETDELIEYAVHRRAWKLGPKTHLFERETSCPVLEHIQDQCQPLDH